MTKKLLSIVMLVLVLCMLIALGNSVQAANLEAKTPTQETIDGKVFVFANGTPITIESRADGQDGATIKWGENGTMDVPADANIFGGGHEEDGVYASSSIVMNGGTVKTVFAGGLHKSHVATGNIVVNSGTIKNYVQGGGASSFSGTTCHKPWYKGNQEGATTVVDNTTIVINGGNMFGVFGGGEGIASTKNVEVTVNGGTITYLCAGGTNGYTNNATVKVTAGEVRIMQGVNRGSVDSIEAEVTGGTIENLYVVGDSSDSTVTGTVSSVKVDVAGDAIVENLLPGTNGGTEVTPDTTGIETAVSYNKENVQNIDTSKFAQTSLTKYVNVKINNNTYRLEEGKTLEDLDLSDVKEVEGKNFVKFVVAGTTTEFDETKAITEDIALSAVYEDKVVTPEEKPDKEDTKTEEPSKETEEKEEAEEKDDTPKTGVIDVTVYAVLTATIAVAGIAVARKMKK